MPLGQRLTESRGISVGWRSDTGFFDRQVICELCVCICVYTPGHGELFLLLGDRECRGSPSNEAPLHTPGKRTALCSGEGSWGMHSTLFISFGVPFLVSGTLVQNPT